MWISYIAVRYYGMQSKQISVLKILNKKQDGNDCKSRNVYLKWIRGYLNFMKL